MGGRTEILWGVGRPRGLFCRTFHNRLKSDPMTAIFDSHRPATAFEHDSSLVAALELSGKSWQVGAVVPGVTRQPRRELAARDMEA